MYSDLSLSMVLLAVLLNHFSFKSVLKAGVPFERLSSPIYVGCLTLKELYALNAFCSMEFVVWALNSRTDIMQ